MNREWASKVKHSAALFFFGSIVLALVSLLSILLALDLATTAFAYLLVVVLVSLRGRFLVAALLSIASVAILIAEPTFDFQVDLAQDFVLLVAFLMTSLIVTGLVGRARQQTEAALQAEAKAREAERELRLAVDTIPALLWSALPDGSLDFLNQRWEEIGLSLEDLRGSKWAAVLHPDERAVALDKWRTAVETGTPYENIERVRMADGEYRWVLSRARPLRDELGKIIKWYGTDTDIQDRIRAEEVLREQARLLDLTHDTIFVRDMHNTITYWNRGAEELYGWTAEETVGKVTSHELLRTVFPAPIDRIDAELLRTGRWEGELVHTTADGTQVVVSSRWSLQRDDQGRPLAILETNNDVTERKRAELKLQRSEGYLAEAQRLSLTGSFGWNVSSGEIFWSDETFRLFGYDKAPSADVGMVLQRVHPEDLALVQQTIELATSGGKDFDFEHRLQMPDSSVKHVHVVARAVADASGGIEFVGAVMDVTAVERAERLLAGEKLLLEMIARGDSRALILNALCRLVEERVSGSLSSILLLDPNANRLRHGAASSLPISYSEAIDGIVIGPSVGSCGTAAYRAKPVVVSDIATDPLWADYRDLALAHGLRACWSTPILSSAGKVLGTFAVYYREPRRPTAQELDDIGQVTHLASIAVERKQAEEALRERANLLDLTHDTIFVRDMRDVITYWNRGATELYGWTREEALHKVSHQLTQTIFPAPLAEINAELLRTGRWEGELIHTKRDGKQVVVVSRWSLQRDEDGLPFAILETNNDITNRKQAEDALRHAQADLVHAARVTTLGELTASIAHEVNQPLAGVVSSGNACLRWLTSEPPNIQSARQSAGRIIRDANRASDVVGRIRSLAKKDPLQKHWLSVNETVVETIGLTRMEVAQHYASLKAQLSDDVPLVWADRIQLQQVILNLIINALEAVSAVSDGPRNLFVSTAKYESDSMLLTVCDSGTGLDLENFERIFDAFYTTKREGMGMGLAVSRSIIEAHGGRLWATPNEPRGAVFQFTLPIGREETS